MYSKLIIKDKGFNVVSDRYLFKALSYNFGTMTATYKNVSTLNIQTC